MKFLSNNKYVHALMKKIGQSIVAGNPVSTPRLQSWVLLLLIIIQVFIFTLFEIFAFIIAAKTGVYTISAEFIIIFGMVLSHQLALVFSRKTSQSINEIKGDKLAEPEHTDEPKSDTYEQENT